VHQSMLISEDYWCKQPVMRLQTDTKALCNERSTCGKFSDVLFHYTKKKKSVNLIS